jgi:serine/threonine protein kinase
LKLASREKACYDLFGYHSPGIVATYLTLLEQGLYEKRPQDLRLLSFQKHYRLGSLSSEISAENASPIEALFGPSSQGAINRNKAVSSLLQGLITLHSKNLIHRDIKLENTLLDGDKGVVEDIVIADLGSACHISETIEEELSGTREYLAPEILKPQALLERQKAVTQKADVWAMGLVLARIYLPFWKASSDPLSLAYAHAIEELFSHPGMRAICYIKNLTQESFLPPSSDPMQRLIYDMLRIDPSQRISSQEALSRWDQQQQTTTN